MDWNSDGKKDLVLGENNGNVRIYRNTNTDADPQFNGYTLVQVAGSNYDVGSYSSPEVIDWNEDGLKDLLVANSSGYVYYLQNVGTPLVPAFSSAVQLKDGTGNLDAGSTVCPVAVDWNGDNKKDLIIGESSGYIVYYENYGTNAAPVFNGKVRLKAGPGGTTDLDVGYYARPWVCDWDEDGMLDIVTGFYASGGNPNAGAMYFHGTHYQYPDLAIDTFKTPAQADPGENIYGKLDLIVKNIGDVASGSFTASLYISTDNQIDKYDTPLTNGSVTVPSIVNGGTHTVAWTNPLGIPSGLDLGNYYIGVLLDEDNLVYELNENNNEQAEPIQIGDPPVPDIKVNGSDGPITVSSAQSSDITIALHAGSMAGTTQDWWILAYKNNGKTFAWVYALPYHWSTLFQKAHRGPLFNLNGYTIHQGKIPAGTYTIEFSVDDPNILHEKTYWDEIEVIST